jgi:glycosyltransferase involved in cell wall biosynthesis
MSLISICIPAFKHIDYLQRLLDSVAIQTFRDFEVVITDDSPDDQIERLIKNFNKDIEIHYYRNEKALGTPENWNEAIRKAKGIWIKLMHNDDWFTSENSLQIFYENIQRYPEAVFFYSAFQNVDQESGKKEPVRMSLADKISLRSNPYHLLKKVYIGNPSCTLVRKDRNVGYDKRYKFIVDFDYYIRMILHTGEPVYIDQILLNIGFHAEQVTSYTKYNPSVQIPENLIFLSEQTENILKDVYVFDYYWRLLRNLKIDSVKKLMSYAGEGIPNRHIASMINFQKRIPYSLLKNGVISKICMLVCYGSNLLKN